VLTGFRCTHALTHHSLDGFSQMLFRVLFIQRLSVFSGDRILRQVPIQPPTNQTLHINTNNIHLKSLLILTLVALPCPCCDRQSSALLLHLRSSHHFPPIENWPAKSQLVADALLDAAAAAAAGVPDVVDAVVVAVSAVADGVAAVAAVVTGVRATPPLRPPLPPVVGVVLAILAPPPAAAAVVASNAVYKKIMSFRAFIMF